MIGTDEDRKMTPCQLYTVYLQKQDGGLGVALVDGLVSGHMLARIVTYCIHLHHRDLSRSVKLVGTKLPFCVATL